MAKPVGSATSSELLPNYNDQFQYIQAWQARAFEAIRQQNIPETAGLIGELLDFSIVNEFQSPELYEFTIKFIQHIADNQIRG